MNIEQYLRGKVLKIKFSIFQLKVR